MSQTIPVSGAALVDAALADAALRYHREAQGKIEIRGRVPVESPADLALAYTPGVAAVSLAIARDPDASFTHTRRGNLVAIISDGSAVLGLGRVGPLAATPVIEGKALLLKHLAGIDAFPLAVAADDPGTLVTVARALEPTFGAIVLEDVAAPACFTVVEQLERQLDIPVFHDDQHGTAAAVGAALLNALRLTGRRVEDARIVVNGAGAAGLATARLLLELGPASLVVCDSRGILAPGREGMNPYKEAVARAINPQGRTGSLADALEGADVFVGLSTAGALKPEQIGRMAPDPVVFALANPEPEIGVEAARGAGAAVAATGRSDDPNQINNVLIYPGLLKGALAVRARAITPGMVLAAARALASLEDPAGGRLLPSIWDQRVVPAVAEAVARQAAVDGVAREGLELGL